MSLTVQIPGPEDDYALPLNQNAYRAVFNGIFLSISQRLKALELTEADYEAAIAAIVTQALAIVSANITDEVDAQRLVLAEIQASAAAIVEAYETLIGSGVPASSVSVSAIAGISATNVQSALAELAIEKANAADFTTLANALTGQVQTAINAIDTRAQTIALSIAYSGAR